VHFLMSGPFTLKKADNRINKGSASISRKAGKSVRRSRQLCGEGLHKLFSLATQRKNSHKSF
jgi:hypothetical protein